MSGPDKQALLIGIDRYLHAEMGNLSGCTNDVEAMAAVLRDRFAFSAASMAILLNEQATREAILASLEQLVARTGTGDIVVISYHGHGSQMTDRSGDEPDGLDETIVPHDSGRDPHENRDITDDELHAFFLRLRQLTPNLTVIFDCCHSGSMSRDSLGIRLRQAPPDTRPVAALPPLAVDPKQLRAAQAQRPGHDYVMLTACRDEEVAFEHRSESGAHGALTHFLTQALAAAPPEATWRDLFEVLSAQVTANMWRQHPQLEGRRDRLLFGVTDAAPLSYFAVGGRTADHIQLRAGAAHGLALGSELAVYAAATKSLSPELLALGRIRITALKPATSTAQILSESSPDLIDEGCRAVEELRLCALSQLRVAVQDCTQDPRTDSPQAQALRTELASSRLLLSADLDLAASEVCVRLLPARSAASAADPAPQLGPLAAPTWAVLGQDGRLLVPPLPAARRGALAWLRDKLEQLAKHRQALALANPDPQSRLRAKVELLLLRQEADGSFAPATPDASGQIVCRDGERVALEIVSHHDQPIYVSVLDFGQDASISQLYPIKGAAEALAPGGRIRFGVTDEEELYLGQPESLRSLGDPPEYWRRVTELWKLVAATQSLDLSMLEQDAARAGGQARAHPAGPLGSLERLLQSGEPIRNVYRRTPGQPDDWTTVERTFVIERNPSQ